jgi:hypothetical protein
MATRILALLLGLSGGFATHYTLLILGFIHLDRSFTLANIALTAVHVKLRLLLRFFNDQETSNWGERQLWAAGQ